MPRCTPFFVLVVLAALGCKKSTPAEPESNSGRDPGGGLTAYTIPDPSAPPAIPSLPSVPSVPVVPRPGVTTWPSDPALAARLDAPVEYLGYQLRPPKGYATVTRQRGVTTVPELAWLADPVPSDRVRPKFAVTVYYPPGGPTSSLQNNLTIESSRPRLTFADVVQQPAEWGQINGVAFGRVRWAGKHWFKTVNAAGSVYVAIDGKAIIWMTVEDEAPNGPAPAVALAEEAFLTFRRADPTTPTLDLGPTGTKRLVPGRADDLPVGGVNPNNGAAFRDVAPAGGILVGFDLGPAQYFRGVDVVGMLRPIYRVGDKDVPGQLHGVDQKRSVRVVAKPGYAVGAVRVNTGLWIDACSVTFMKVAGDRLDPKDSYESAWTGDKANGLPATLGGDGTPVIGITGHTDGENRVTAVGLLYLRPGR